MWAYQINPHDLHDYDAVNENILLDLNIGGRPRKVLAHRGGPPIPPAAGDVAAAVGPEGGFTDEEVGQARSAGWTAVGLGPRILRVETAALVLAVRAAFV